MGPKIHACWFTESWNAKRRISPLFESWSKNMFNMRHGKQKDGDVTMLFHILEEWPTWDREAKISCSVLESTYGARG